MRHDTDRAIFTVIWLQGRWAVEHDGLYYDRSADKEVAKAGANKRARAAHDDGRACLVRVTGEHGFFAQA